MPANAGDILLDDDGNVILEDDGDTFLSDGAGDDCCCDGLVCHLCDVTPASMTVTLAGILECGGCRRDAGNNFNYQTNGTDDVNGTYTVPLVTVTTSPTSQCRWELRVTGDFGTIYAPIGSTCVTPTGTLDTLYIHVTATVVAGNVQWELYAELSSSSSAGATLVFIANLTGDYCEGSGSALNNSYTACGAGESHEDGTGQWTAD